MVHGGDKARGSSRPPHSVLAVRPALPGDGEEWEVALRKEVSVQQGAEPPAHCRFRYIHLHGTQENRLCEMNWFREVGS